MISPPHFCVYKLVRDFGCDHITPAMIERIERLTKRKVWGDVKV